jgi:predicted acetyltransferase
MEIRPVPHAEIETMIYLSAQAFRNGHRQPYVPDPNYEPRDVFGVYDARGLQAKVVVIPYQTHLGPDVVVPMGGIAGVACLPASRGRGYVGQCLDYTLERMREKGQVISLLFPFAWDFYRRYGWDWVGRRTELSVPTRVLLADPETENVRAATREDWQAIQALYTRRAGLYRGMTRRNERAWNSILEDSKDHYTYTYLYEHAGAIEGYLTYRGGKKERTDLREFIALTARAYRALLGLLRRHEMQIEKFVWDMPSDDTFWSVRMHWDVETRVQPETQARVVDVVGALRAWKPDAERRGSTVIRVRDEHAPWNQGAWKIDFEAGHVAIASTHGEPHIDLDIQALSQAYLGTPNTDDLRRAERINVHDEAGYRAFRDLLAGPPMAMNDSF